MQFCQLYLAIFADVLNRLDPSVNRLAHVLNRLDPSVNRLAHYKKA